MGVVEELKDMGLSVRESDNPDREKIDFSIEDGQDNVAWVWGSGEPVSVDGKYDLDYEVECDHAVVEYDDDETVGECLVCGATCDWHWECYVDCGYTQKSQVPHHWNAYHEGNGGIIKKYIEENYGHKQN